MAKGPDGVPPVLPGAPGVGGEARDAQALFIGTAFLAVAIIDSMHTLSFPGMPEFVTPSPTNKAILIPPGDVRP